MTRWVAKPELIRLTTGADLSAPLSLYWEIGNALSAMLKRKRTTLAEARQALIEYQKIPIRFLDVALDDMLVAVEHYQLYAYDAYFLVCARQQACPLITLDGGLQTAARTAHPIAAGYCWCPVESSHHTTRDSRKYSGRSSELRVNTAQSAAQHCMQAAGGIGAMLQIRIVPMVVSVLTVVRSADA
jgi:predicted nucleic acid-binding protein